MVRLWVVQVSALFGKAELTVHESADAAQTYAIARTRLGRKVHVWEL